MDEYELQEIKREIVESRSLSIKTNNLVNALAADVKSIAKRHQMQERRLFVNGAAAYVVTIAVVLVFVQLACISRAGCTCPDHQPSRAVQGATEPSHGSWQV